jgi:predicted NBD/HSP70 family sugar kinase
VDPAKPQADEYVLRALMRHRRLTRAELAAEIGISKPTAGESVRRLTERKLVVDTGERTPGGRGRGRVGSYYALAPEVGTALAVSIAPEGIVAERLNAYGEVVVRESRRISRPALTAEVAAALTEAVTSAARQVRPRLAVVSAADPVDRETGRLVQLPDAPFLVGELDPVEILTAEVDGPVIVDNDVNWAAQAERRDERDDFAYLFLGEGLGCAIVSDGEVRRGRHGLAGEVAHIVTEGPGGRAIPFTDVFAELRRPASTAIDVDRLLTEANREVIGAAVAGVVAALIALADPDRVVIGGGWGPAFLDAITGAVADLPRQVPIQAVTVTDEPALAGVRRDAVERLRRLITDA